MQTTKTIDWRTATDAEKNVAVAEHVAGWKDFGPGSPAYQIHYGVSVMCGFQLGSVSSIVPDYLHDADAVIALLEKASKARQLITDGIWFDKMGAYWTYEGHIPGADTDPLLITSASFCEPSCIALLRANGVEVIE